VFKKSIAMSLRNSIWASGMDDEDDQSRSLEEFLQDSKRVKYYQDYLSFAAKAIR
jgi:hypothetical protein